MRRLRVDWRASVGLVGTVVKYLSMTLLVPLAVALYYMRDVATFAAAFILTIMIGVALERVDPDPDLGAREGFLMVALTWLVVAVVQTGYVFFLHWITVLGMPTSLQKT
jgi:trk system potassium uptake protein TrkH